MSHLTGRIDRIEDSQLANQLKPIQERLMVVYEGVSKFYGDFNTYDTNDAQHGSYVSQSHAIKSDGRKHSKNGNHVNTSIEEIIERTVNKSLIVVYLIEHQQIHIAFTHIVLHMTISIQMDMHKIRVVNVSRKVHIVMIMKNGI